MTEIDKLFKITVNTPYPEKDIIEFMYLTGIGIDDTEKIMNNFCKCGVSNLVDVNTLVKMGYFNYAG